MSSNTIGGFMAETRNATETPNGATIRLRRQGRPGELEYFVDVERNGETVTLCKDEPHDVAQFWAKLTAEMERQETDADGSDDSEEFANPWEFDEYGPTRRHPLPDGELAMLLPAAVDKRELPGTGLAPSDYEIVNGAVSPKTAAQNGFHPDDHHRPERYERECERLAEVESERDEPDPDRAGDTMRAVADGGEEIDDSDDWGNYEPGDTVRLLEDVAVGLNTGPNTIEAEVSTTGKSVMIPEDADSIHGSRRLDAETIFSGGSEYRDSTGYQIYTPGRYQNKQRSNYAPGPQAGANEVSDTDGLPDPTHWPEGDNPDDAPDECPECGGRGPWNDVGKPRCERCGVTVDPDQEEADAEDVAEAVPDKWDLSRLSRGDVLELAGHEAEFVITEVSTFVGNDTVNYLEVAARDAGEWTEYTIQKVSPAGPKLKLTEDGPAVGIIVDDPDLIGDFEKIREDEEMLRDCIRQKFEQNAERVKSD